MEGSKTSVAVRPKEEMVLDEGLARNLKMSKEKQKKS